MKILYLINKTYEKQTFRSDKLTNSDFSTNSQAKFNEFQNPHPTIRFLRKQSLCSACAQVLYAVQSQVAID